jgi:hypothetical protein
MQPLTRSERAIFFAGDPDLKNLTASRIGFDCRVIPAIFLVLRGKTGKRQPGASRVHAFLSPKHRYT